MKKMRRFVRIVPLLLLAAILAFVPLAGIACDEEEEVVLRADFTASPRSGVSPLTVAFTSTSTGEITSYAWDFGDGGTSTDQNPTHVYTLDPAETVKSYTVILEVTGPDGDDEEVKAQYIGVSAIEYPRKLLRLSYGMMEGQVGGMAAQKFADLLDLYTNGKVQVDIFPAGTLYSYTETFEATKTGAVDIGWEIPYFLRLKDPNLDWSGSMYMILSNCKHGRDILEDGRVVDITRDMLLDEGVYFLGYEEITHFGGWFNNVRKIEALSDYNGMKLGNFQMGPLDVLGQYLQVENVPIAWADLHTALATGVVDCITNSIEGFVTQGFADLLPHGFMVVTWTSCMPIMNLDTWNGLGADLQALITDVVFPEVQEFSLEEAYRQDRGYLTIALDKMDDACVITPEYCYELYTIMKEYDDYKTILGKVNPEIIEIIEEYRPTEYNFDPEILEIIEYVGLDILEYPG